MIHYRETVCTFFDSNENFPSLVIILGFQPCDADSNLAYCILSNKKQFLDETRIIFVKPAARKIAFERMQILIDNAIANAQKKS